MDPRRAVRIPQSFTIGSLFVAATIAIALALVCSDSALALSLSVSPEEVYVDPETETEFTVVLSEPAEVGGEVVSLSYVGVSGTLPPMVLVPQGDSTATFLFTAGSVEEEGLIQAFSFDYGYASAIVHISETVGVEGHEGEYGWELRLLAAEPSPFGDRTVLRFVLLTPGWTRVNVYDLSGREVDQIENSMLSRGVHAVEWDGCDERGTRVAPGIYFYRVAVGDHQKAGRVVFVR